MPVPQGRHHGFYHFVGLDVHKETIVAVARSGRGSVESLGMIPNRPDAIARLMRKLGPKEVLTL